MRATCADAALSLEETTLMLAWFCAVHEVKPSRARAHLEPSQREAFAEAVDLVDMNEAIVQALRDAPETLVGGLFPVVRTRGFFARLFAKPAEPDALTLGRAELLFFGTQKQAVQTGK